MTTVEVPRDRYGRPLIVPPDGGEPQPYTRVSSLAKVLDDQTELGKWRQRKTAEGLARRPDLLTRVAGAIVNGDPDADWPTKRALNDVCAEAVEAAGASKGRSAGTGLHALTEALDRGEEDSVWPLVPAETADRLRAYIDATLRLEPVAAELFVVCDELRAAGTFDRLWRLPDGRVVVGDLKTGKSEADYPLAAAVQMAVYAHSEAYDPDEGTRTPPHPDFDPTVGLLVHMPPSGGCRVIPLDLTVGWQVARTAAYVHGTVRKLKPADVILPAVT